MNWSERTVVREGVRISCRDWGGTGHPLVLLHGLAGHAGERDVVARGLSPRYRVIAVDQRGHGAGERHPSDVSRAAYVADAVAVIDQLALRQPVLMGQSLGGHTACPTLTVLGQSGIITPQEADGMFRKRPHTVAVSIPGTGHDVHLEQPDVLRQVLQGFLSEVLAATPAQSARVERA